MTTAIISQVRVAGIASAVPENVRTLEDDAQVFGQQEIERISHAEARAANVDAARRALALRRAANFTIYPAAGDTANKGMISRPSRRRITKVSRKRIGSISQATKVSQAKRDSRK